MGSMSAQVPGHVHVTEREGDGTWEDCAFVTAVEMMRTSGRSDIPATHAEAERLRAASGLPEEHTGASIGRVQAGIAARYGLRPAMTFGWSALLARLVPGTVAVVQGNMHALDDHWQRWDRPFSSRRQAIHQGYFARLTSESRGIWCDPLAPANGTYQGEWMPLSVLGIYVRAFSANGHIVRSFVSDIPPESSTGEAMVNTDAERFTGPRQFSTNAGLAKLRRFEADAEISSIPAPYSGWVDASVTITRSDGGTPHGAGFLRLSAGGSAGEYILAAEVTLGSEPPSDSCAPLLSKISDAENGLRTILANLAE